MAIRPIIMVANAEQAGQSNAISQYEFVRTGTIVGIQWTITADLDADQEQATYDLSRQATFQGDTHDSLGPIAIFTISAGITTSGMAKTSECGFYPSGIRMLAGERLYLNANLTTTTAATLRLVVFIDE